MIICDLKKLIFAYLETGIFITSYDNCIYWFNGKRLELFLKFKDYQLDSAFYFQFHVHFIGIKDDYYQHRILAKNKIHHWPERDLNEFHPLILFLNPNKIKHQNHYYASGWNALYIYKKEWILINDQLNLNFISSIVALGDCIYIYDVYNNSHNYDIKKCVQVVTYNIITHEVSKIKPCSIDIRYRMYSLGDKMYAISHCGKIFEMYDPQKDQWQRIKIL
jgi:hypothetical protein